MARFVRKNNKNFSQYTTQRVLQESFDTGGYLRTQMFFSDSPIIDSFGRLRVSNPTTLFDSKQIFKDHSLGNNVENFPLFFDNQETHGTGSITTYDNNTASTTLSVSDQVEGTRVGQTKMRFNYQPGKSILIFKTFMLGEHVEGVVKRDGYFDEKNGLFLEDDGENYNFVVRSYVSSGSVDVKVPQSQWNIDSFDGEGLSGVKLDFTKTQISVLDFEWLGVGRVRAGFVVGGIIYYAHEFNNANNLSTVYMSTPNLPLRCEISNDGSGGEGHITQICSSIISEGGTNHLGVLRYASTDETHVDTNVIGTVYAIIGIRLKTSYLGMSIKIIDMSMLVENNNNFEWILILNPVVAGTFTYVDESLSGVQIARGATENTITGGYKIAGGFVSVSTRNVANNLENALLLGSSISGVRDEMVLCARPLGSNANVRGGFTWRELS